MLHNEHFTPSTYWKSKLALFFLIHFSTVICKDLVAVSQTIAYFLRASHRPYEPVPLAFLDYTVANHYSLPWQQLAWLPSQNSALGCLCWSRNTMSAHICKYEIGDSVRGVTKQKLLVKLNSYICKYTSQCTTSQWRLVLNSLAFSMRYT